MITVLVAKCFAMICRVIVDAKHYTLLWCNSDVSTHFYHIKNI